MSSKYELLISIRWKKNKEHCIKISVMSVFQQHYSVIGHNIFNKSKVNPYDFERIIKNNFNQTHWV